MLKCITYDSKAVYGKKNSISTFVEISVVNTNKIKTGFNHLLCIEIIKNFKPYLIFKLQAKIDIDSWNLEFDWDR